MKVWELIEQLKSFDPDALVVMSKDAEGNAFSPLEDIENTRKYLADSTWSGEMVMTELTTKSVENGFTEEDVYEGDDAVKAVCLWPVN